MQTLLESMDVKAATKNAEENALTIGDLVSLFTQDATQMAEEVELEAENQNEILIGDAEEVEPEAENQNEIEIEDVIANVEVSDESVQENVNLTHGETKETVNVVNESSGSPDETEQAHDSDEDYGNTNDWWENNSDSSYSDPYFESADDSIMSGNSDCEEILSDVGYNESELNREPVIIVDSDNVESVDENIDVQSDIEVDDIIAMNEVDMIVVDQELSEYRDEDVRIDNTVRMEDVAIDSARTEDASIENTRVEKDASKENDKIFEDDKTDDIRIKEAVVIQNSEECAREGASIEDARIENSGIVEDARRDERKEEYANTENNRIVEGGC